MTCRGCGKENRPGARFCAGCGTALAVTCPACGADAEPDDRFCATCGSALGETTAGSVTESLADVAHVSERRLVSILFADLVGFTSMSEHRDPEEVRELLSEYFERSRELIERYGGTVEKFIGDAVMAVWGTPVAREDDAERAVRAALALTQAVSTLGAEVGMPELRVRAGVLTGNAAVEIGAEHEGMVLGDAVNTASRLQSLAAPGTVLVDDVTRRSSEAAIAYEDAGTHQVKGREQPVRAWLALRVVAGAGGARRAVGLEAPLVGRERELSLIIEAGEESASRAAARLVTVIGEAGAGKSRLLWEFFKYLDGIQDVRWWHQGRCLSYGEGVAYWALADMVRSRAGILEEEDPASAREKLRAAVEQHVLDERERRLVEPRLAHLLGLEHRNAPDRADLFSGWRLFFERLATTSPVIMAFEDLQWADSGLLDFIDYMLEWAGEFPIFILAFGRPELLGARPAWQPTMTLEPLADGPMTQLLNGLVPGLPEPLLAQVRRRAEGVPLYAVETVRMLLDRGLIVQDGARYVLTSDVADLEVPETLHALAAARLDNLDTSERALLQDAAVIGQSFSPAMLTAVAGRRATEVQGLLDGLVAKQVLGYIDDVRHGERGQYVFLQSLLRQVSFATLSRRDRKARHLAAAEHLRTSWGDTAEIAEVLANHYLSAVEADPAAADAQAIRASACHTLADAGRRAVSLALGEEARRYFERAAELTDDPAERAKLLAEAGGAAARTADRASAQALLEQAIEALESCGRVRDAAAARASLADLLIMENELDAASEVIERARESLDDEVVLAGLAATRARIAFLAGDHARALQEAELALSIADPRQLHESVASAAMTKAIALYYDGRLTEAGALMSLGLQVALDADLGEEAIRGYYNLADYRVATGAPSEAAVLLERGLELVRERGHRTWERMLLTQQAEVHGFVGEYAEAARLADVVVATGEDDAADMAAMFKAIIAAKQGDAEVLDDWLAHPPEDSEWQEQELMRAVARAVALHARGRSDEAAEVIRPVVGQLARLATAAVSMALDGVIDLLIDVGEPDLVEELLMPTDKVRIGIVDGQLLRCRGLLHLQRGDLAGAERALSQADALLRAAGNPYSLARNLLDYGTTFTALGRPGDAAVALQEARRLFISLGTAPWIERVDRVLGSLSPEGPEPQPKRTLPLDRARA
ncbi:MAG TPA: adenylate/guanylate cyclase domain-containing protein [Solirubrobacteraceae bacterium]